MYICSIVCALYSVQHNNRDSFNPSVLHTIIELIYVDAVQMVKREKQHLFLISCIAPWALHMYCQYRGISIVTVSDRKTSE